MSNQLNETQMEAVSDLPSGGEETAEKKKKKKFKINFKDKKTKKLIKRIIIILVIAAILAGAYAVYAKFFKKSDIAAAAITTSEAVRGELEVTITGSGVIEAMNTYEIVPMVRGSILTAPFEEGEIVEEGTVLYTFDSEEAQNSIKKAQNSITRAEISARKTQESLKDWVLTAPASGHISGLNVKVGDSVNTNQKICTITNDDVMTVEIPFAAASIDHIYIGAQAQLTSADYMTGGIYGTVSDIDYTPVRSNDGGVMYNVEITFDNPGAITEGMVLTASVNGQVCAAGGTTSVSENEEAVMAASGTVTAVYYKNGDTVSEGRKIIEITDSDTLDSITKSNSEYEDLLLSLNSAYDTLDDYTITSPITGTVIQKNYKAGETVGSSSTATTLATIADISKMKFTMDVDELDIKKIQIGQSVDIVADALEDQIFVGSITQIVQQGESTNGVTTYPVEVVIDAPGELMIGMNVTATVVVESKQDTLKIPIDAVTVSRGKSYVQVLKSELKKDNSRTEPAAPDGSSKNIPGDMPSGGAQTHSGKSASTEGASDKMQNTDSRGASTAPKQEYTMDDFERVEVTTGINNEDEIEILSGISEGDIIYVSTQSENKDTNTTMPGGMGGGMPGGMGGGMPSGGGMPGDGMSSGGGTGGNRGSR